MIHPFLIFPLWKVALQTNNGIQRGQDLFPVQFHSYDKLDQILMDLLKFSQDGNKLKHNSDPNLLPFENAVLPH